MTGIEYRISGGFGQLLEVRGGGSNIMAQSGTMVWMSGMQMTTSGGEGALARAFGGGGYFIARFSPDAGSGAAGFAPRRAGQIIPFELDGSTSLLCERHSFLASSDGVEISVALQKTVRAGLFGGEGFILQKISGRGIVFLSCGGAATEHNLRQGDSISVDPGHVAFFEDRVPYSMEVVPGLKNFLFGGEGLFLARLSGPGRVWTQSYGWRDGADNTAER